MASKGTPDQQKNLRQLESIWQSIKKGLPNHVLYFSWGLKLNRRTTKSHIREAEVNRDLQPTSQRRGRSSRGTSMDTIILD